MCRPLRPTPTPGVSGCHTPEDREMSLESRCEHAAAWPKEQSALTRSSQLSTSPCALLLPPSSPPKQCRCLPATAFCAPPPPASASSPPPTRPRPYPHPLLSPPLPWQSTFHNKHFPAVPSPLARFKQPHSHPRKTKHHENSCHAAQEGHHSREQRERGNVTALAPKRLRPQLVALWLEGTDVGVVERREGCPAQRRIRHRGERDAR